MRPIKKSLRARIEADPYFKVCARKDAKCNGRMTVEHAFIYANRQVDEYWNFVPLCWYHHLGEGLVKKENERIALSRATDEDLAKYPRRDWNQLKKYLNI